MQIIFQFLLHLDVTSVITVLETFSLICATTSVDTYSVTGSVCYWISNTLLTHGNVDVLEIISLHCCVLQFYIHIT